MGSLGTPGYDIPSCMRVPLEAGKSAEMASIPTICAFGLRICKLCTDDLLRWLDQQVLTSHRRSVFMFTANVDHVVRCHRDTEFRRLYQQAEIITVDGMALLWAARLLQHNVAQRVTGIDLLYGLCGLAAEKGYSCFFLGARAEVLDAMLHNLRRSYPGLRICGWHHGYFERETEVLDQVARANPVILFVGMGSPRQETFLCRNRERLNCRLAAPVGGSFNVAAGQIRRAPDWLQQLGCEWLWRLSHEPRRLWRRYLIDDVAFIPIFARNFAQSILAAAGKNFH